MFGLFRKATAAQSKADDRRREEAAAKDHEEAEKALTVQKHCQLAIFKLRCAQDDEALPEDLRDNASIQDAVNRFEGHKIEAIELARSITDQFYRDFALACIVDACMAADQRPQAREFLAVMKVDIARERVLKDHPTLAAPPLPGD
ncbi:MAG: hypothetical protein AB7I36_05875 [Rhodospirillaceae bacterium]